MDSAFGNQRLFHSPVNVNKMQTTDTLIVNGRLTSDPDTLSEGWADYYEELLLPRTNLNGMMTN